MVEYPKIITATELLEKKEIKLPKVEVIEEKPEVEAKVLEVEEKPVIVISIPLKQVEEKWLKSWKEGIEKGIEEKGPKIAERYVTGILHYLTDLPESELTKLRSALGSD
jgi:hypothetical protein